MERDLTQGDEHTIQYIDDVLQNCTPETYIIVLISHHNKFHNIKQNILVQRNMCIYYNYKNSSLLYVFSVA